jgi:hypothetical protein
MTIQIVKGFEKSKGISISKTLLGLILKRPTLSLPFSFSFLIYPARSPTAAGLAQFLFPHVACSNSLRPSSFRPKSLLQPNPAP